jgi:hypothetical protein
MTAFRRYCRLLPWQTAAALAVASLLAAAAQDAAAQEPDGPVIRDSSVGYIDAAIPGDVIRFRYDAAYNNRQPSRAEFFYPRAGSLGPGPSQRETSVDYQDLALYGETLVTSSFSAFVEAPFRWINPDINPNADGFGDMNAGVKFAFIDCPDLVTSFQFRTYIPTGNSHDGLGTNHVSLEPALLLYRPLSDRLRLESELRYWIPVGGTEFAGDIIRYGAGLSYAVPVNCCWQVAPVAEFVGWTALGGQTAFAQGPGQFVIEDADGDTIVNAKLGLRATYSDVGDVYFGYGRPLTGDEWYENTWRVELRWFY